MKIVHTAPPTVRHLWSRTAIIRSSSFLLVKVYSTLMPLFLEGLAAHSRSSRIVRSPFETYTSTPLASPVSSVVNPLVFLQMCFL